MIKSRKTSPKTKVLAIAKAALDKKALDVVMLNVAGLCSFADYFLVTSGTSDRHVQAIAEGIILKMKSKGIKPIGVEGMQKSHWVLVDFGDIVVHIFYRPIREFYGLEKLWADAKLTPIVDEPKKPRAKKPAK